jgi:subtilisin family serine protease
MGMNAASATSSENNSTDTTEESDYVPDQIVVQFNTNSSSDEQVQSEVYQRISDQTDLNIQIIDESKIVLGLKLVEIVNCTNLDYAIEIFRQQPEIQFAEKNYLIKIQNIPNDTYYGNLWGLNNTGKKDQSGNIGKIGADISAQKAWDITTGSETIIVAVIDTGVDINHPDLMNNIWTNPNEIPNNGIDDDNNGFIDDVNGWNFSENNNDVSDPEGHGTHCAGIIGAVGNNSLGVTGVNWNIQIMPIKLKDPWTLYLEAQAVYYASNMGASVINCSYGDYNYSNIAKTAYESSSAIIICASGNETINNDLKPSYPCNYNIPNIVSVASTNNQDELSSFSNYGVKTVHLGAPGEDIYSTFPRALIHKGNLPYRYMSGTSMAAPYVSGVCALIKAVNPNLNNVQIKDVLLNSVDPLSSLNGKVLTGGRLNAYQAVLNAQNTVLSPFSTIQSEDEPILATGETDRKKTNSIINQGIGLVSDEMETVVLDENGYPVIIACPGQELTVILDVENDGELDFEDPYVLIFVDPENGLIIDPSAAIMTYYYDDGSNETFINDPLDPFLFWSDVDHTWKWWIGWAVPDHDMWPGEVAKLNLNASLANIGPITVTSVLKAWDEPTEEYETLDTDNYSFRSVPCPHPCPHPPCAGATVPMQSTGTPLAVAALGLLSIIGGVIYSKQK